MDLRTAFLAASRTNLSAIAVGVFPGETLGVAREKTLQLLGASTERVSWATLEHVLRLGDLEPIERYIRGTGPSGSIPTLARELLDELEASRQTIERASRLLDRAARHEQLRREIDRSRVPAWKGSHRSA